MFKKQKVLMAIKSEKNLNLKRSWVYRISLVILFLIDIQLYEKVKITEWSTSPSLIQVLWIVSCLLVLIAAIRSFVLPLFKIDQNYFIFYNKIIGHKKFKLEDINNIRITEMNRVKIKLNHGKQISFFQYDLSKKSLAIFENTFMTDNGQK